MKTVCAILAITLASSTLLYGVNETSCLETEFRLATGDIHFSVRHFGLYVGTKGTRAALTLANENTGPVDRILLLAELVDAQGQHMITVPFYGAMWNAPYTERPSFPLAARREMQEPLPPGGQIALPSDIQQSIPRCPAKVRVLIIDVRFVDGTSFHFGSGEWQVEPSVASANFLQLTNLAELPPFQELLDLTIDANGRLLNVECRNPEPKIAEWFRAQISNWTFSPAIKDGKTVPSTLRLLVRAHNTYNQHDPTIFDDSVLTNGSVIVIDVFPKGEIKQNTQFILAGGLPLVVPH